MKKEVIRYVKNKWLNIIILIFSFNKLLYPYINIFCKILSDYIIPGSYGLVELKIDLGCLFIKVCMSVPQTFHILPWTLLPCGMWLYKGVVLSSTKPHL